MRRRLLCSASTYFNNGNSGSMCEICSKLTIKKPERCSVFIVKFQQVLHIVLVFSFWLWTREWWLGSKLRFLVIAQYLCKNEHKKKEKISHICHNLGKSVQIMFYLLQITKSKSKVARICWKQIFLCLLVWSLNML